MSEVDNPLTKSKVVLKKSDKRDSNPVVRYIVHPDGESRRSKGPMPSRFNNLELGAITYNGKVISHAKYKKLKKQIEEEREIIQAAKDEAAEE